MNKLVSIIILLGFIFSKCNLPSFNNELNHKEKGVTVKDLFEEIYNGKELCDPTSKAYLLNGSMGLPQAQNISGAFTANHDIDTTVLVNFLQHEADIFSWETFIAINWPSADGENPDSTMCFDGPKKAVWEGWMPSHRIFKENGDAPDEWPYESSNSQIDELRVFGKVNLGLDDLSNMDSVDADNYPVIDKNGNYVLYEIYYNKEAYNYILDGKLYSKAGQKEFVKTWPDVTSGLTVFTTDSTGRTDTMNIEKEYMRAYFPIGNIKDSIEVVKEGNNIKTYSFSTGTGAMIIKTAWVILNSDEDHSSFYTRNINAGNRAIKIGLVGMHMAHKIAESTQWVWSTFEHKSNAPDMVDGNVSFKLSNYTFFDEKNDVFSLYNKPPEVRYQPDKSERKSTQVVRLLPSQKNTMQVDRFFNELIQRSNESSVWLNYRLVGTQWPLNPDLFTSGSMYQPQLLGNAILETYQQGESSCMGCHRQARFLYKGTDVKGGYSADFIYGLNSAE